MALPTWGQEEARAVVRRRSGGGRHGCRNVAARFFLAPPADCAPRGQSSSQGWAKVTLRLETLAHSQLRAIVMQELKRRSALQRVTSGRRRTARIQRGEGATCLLWSGGGGGARWCLGCMHPAQVRVHAGPACQPGICGLESMWASGELAVLCCAACWAAQLLRMAAAPLGPCARCEFKNQIKSPQNR